MGLPRLIFITGKGGGGKTTVAAALTLALARHNDVTLVRLKHNSPAGPICARGGSAAGKLELKEIDSRAELEAFIERIVPIRAVARRMLRSRTFAYVAAALPGLEAFLILERLRVMTGEAALDDRYIVVDGPATGTALELLAVARATAQLAPRGLLNRLAREVEAFIQDPMRFGAVIVLRPEELSVRETSAAAAALRANGISLRAVLLNGVAGAIFSDSEISRVSNLAGAHAEFALRRHRMSQAAAQVRRRLVRESFHVVELPFFFRTALREPEMLALGVQALQGIPGR